jgi:hypothetical protein
MEAFMLTLTEPLPRIQPDSIWVEPWIDDVVDSLGHDPKSPYVERFWLGLLGPSATWLIRSISYGFDASPTGFHLSTSDTARVLGIGERTGKHSPFQRAIGRLLVFQLAYQRGDSLVVRPRVPWMDPRTVRRFSSPLRHEHNMWEDAEMQSSASNAARRRASSLAMSTVRTGGNVDDAERDLIRAGTHPALSRSMAEWAASQHEIATLAAIRARDL